MRWDFRSESLRRQSTRQSSDPRIDPEILRTTAMSTVWKTEMCRIPPDPTPTPNPQYLRETTAQLDSLGPRMSVPGWGFKTRGSWGIPPFYYTREGGVGGGGTREESLYGPRESRLDYQCHPVLGPTPRRPFPSVPTTVRGKVFIYSVFLHSPTESVDRSTRKTEVQSQDRRGQGIANYLVRDLGLVDPSLGLRRKITDTPEPVSFSGSRWLSFLADTNDISKSQLSSTSTNDTYLRHGTSEGDRSGLDPNPSSQTREPFLHLSCQEPSIIHESLIFDRTNDSIYLRLRGHGDCDGGRFVDLSLSVITYLVS